MIYRDSNLELCSQGGRLTIRERDRSRWITLLRVVLGLGWIAPPGMVFYVLAGGPGAKAPVITGPVNWQAWIIGGFFVSLWSLPMLTGFVIAFTRQRFVFDMESGTFREQILVAGRPVWSKCYPWREFTGIRCSEHRRGRFIISCTGPKRGVRIAEFGEPAHAGRTAARLAEFFGLPPPVLLMAPAMPRTVISRAN